jgi:PAS domain S-box-containing protein
MEKMNVKKRIDGRSDILSNELIKEISDRKHAQNLLSVFVKYAPGAIALFDREMKFLVVSDRWYRDYDLSENDITGSSYYDVFSGTADSHKWEAYHQRVLKGEKLRNEEDRLIKEDGNVIWLKWEMLPWFDKFGVIGGVIMSTEVITYKKKLEDDYRKSKQLLEMAIETGQIGFWHWMEQNNRLEWNEQMFRLFEYDESDFTGDGETFFDVIHPDDEARVRGLLNRAIVERGEYHTQYRVICKSGVKKFKEHGKVFLDDGLLRMTGICQEIPELNLP